MTTATEANAGLEAAREKAAALTKRRNAVTDAIKFLKERKGKRDSKTGAVTVAQCASEEAIAFAAQVLYGEPVKIAEQEALRLLGTEAQTIDKDLRPINRLMEREVFLNQKQLPILAAMADLHLAGDAITLQNLLAICRAQGVDASAAEIQVILSSVGNIYRN